MNKQQFLKALRKRLSALPKAELEERLCPCENHDWKVIGRRTSIHDYGVITHVEQLKCKRCGKTKEREEW